MTRKEYDIIPGFLKKYRMVPEIVGTGFYQTSSPESVPDVMQDK